jgi:hypothetical protein
MLNAQICFQGGFSEFSQKPKKTSSVTEDVLGRNLLKFDIQDLQQTTDGSFAIIGLKMKIG